MARPTALESEPRLVSPAATLDERWNDAAARLLESLLAGQRPPELEPELEHFLRCLIRAKARRFGGRLGQRAQGVDAEDVAQCVFLKLFEHPPNRDAAGLPMRRLVSWVTTVTHNHLCDLASRPTEHLASKGLTIDGEDERVLASVEAPADSRYEAQEALLLVRPAVERDYPLGLPLLTLLEDSPHATSAELALQLGTTAANVDQMRSRIRRVLRNRLGESHGSNRRVR